MNYTVTWAPGAEADLANLWNTHPDRAAVTRAAHELDRTLAIQGPEAGESRDQGLRITFSPPLSVFFQVDGRTVRVVRVWSHA